MLLLRRWSVRHARALSRVYAALARWAPHLAPLVGVLGRRRSETLLRPLERLSKQALFDCRMCGQCVLSSTGMACPMNCAKQMRNGPCGGVRPDGGCEVVPEMRCVWLEAIDGQKAIAAPANEVPATVLAPLDRSRAGASTWLQVICDRPADEPRAPADAAHPDGDPHPGDDACATPGSLEQACRSGRPVVTVEVAPPDSADPAALLARAAHFRGIVDAINVTDGAGGNCHMSSMAASAILAMDGFTPVCQVACRDRNRIAMQGDILGAAALGIRNVLCLTGDDVSRGDHPQARAVFDLDAVSLLGIARGMCDRGEFASGRALETAPRLFLGATANPFVPPHLDRIANLAKKIDAGAQFIQTQFCFDVRLLVQFMREVRARELHRRCAILVGVGTLGSARALRWMGEHVPGVHVPESLIERIARAADPKAEARRACLETIDAVLGIDGVAGVHLMGHRNEDTLAGIIVASGLRRESSGRMEPPPYTQRRSRMNETTGQERELVEQLADMNEEEALAIARRMLLEEKADPLRVLELCRNAMDIVGDRFAQGEYFLPELVLAGEMLESIGAMAKPLIAQGPGGVPARLGKVLIGTVHGDLHDIGKNIVSFMLDINGFEVRDLGIDVPVERFVEEIQAFRPDVVGLSGFLTLAFDSMKETVEAIESAGLRDSVRIMIGGGQIDETVRGYTRADAFGTNAVQAVNQCRHWMGVAA